MAEGSSEDDDPGFAGPLPPEDRLWRHPSEMARGPKPRRSTSWTAVLLSATGGAVAVAVLWFAFDGGEPAPQVTTERVALVPVESVAPIVTPPEEWSATVTEAAATSTSVVRGDGSEEPIAAAVALRDDGYLITSGRAVGDADPISVTGPDGVAHEAEKVAYDAATDVLVLWIDGTTTPAVAAPDDGVEDGDTVALVNPVGDAAERHVLDDLTATAISEGDWLVGVFTLDEGLADVPPGGPAVDTMGAVIGITSATQPADPAAVVPIGVARRVATGLIEDGEIRWPRLGITSEDFGDPGGALVKSMDPTGPAAAGGMRVDDVIVRVGDTDVDSMASMVSEIRHHAPGDPVAIVVHRDGADVECHVVLGDPAPTG